MIEMGTMAINGILQAMTQRVQRQQELIDQLRFDLETQNLENQGLARDLAVAIDEISRSNSAETADRRARRAGRALELSRENVPLDCTRARDRWDSTGEEI